MPRTTGPVAGAANGSRLVGRSTERATIAAEMDRARSGTARVVLVSGEPGIGKTALCRKTVEEAAGFRVLRAAGEESERDLAYGVVDQLLAGVAARPAAALGATPLAVGAGLVQLVSDLEAQGPLLIWVDDLQWADPPSQRALLFLLRRLEADPVLVLLCRREGSETLLAAGLARYLEHSERVRIGLTGLSMTALAGLPELQGMPNALPLSVVRRLRDHTGGNPLWFKALLREIPADRLRDESGQLPAPESFAATVADRLGRLSDESRALVEASAVAGTECSLGLLADVIGLTDSFAALDAAVAEALLLSDGGHPPHVRPVHPLVRSAVYEGLPASRRSRLHAELAQRALSEHDRLRHEISASPGHDPMLSKRVAEAAGLHAARGSWAIAADLFRSAAGLAPSQEQERELLGAAMGAWLMAGETGRAREFRDRLADLPPSARRDSLFGWLSVEEARYDDAERLLLAAVRQAEAAGDLAVVAEASRLLSLLGILHCRASDAETHARRAMDIDPPGSMEAGIALGNLLIALIFSGQYAEVARLTAHIDERSVRPHEIVPLIARGISLLQAGDFRPATRDLLGVIEASRAVGALEFINAAWAQLSAAQYRLGDWDAAVENAERAVQITEDAQQAWATAPVHAYASFVPSRRGDWATASAHVDLAQRSAARSREPQSVAYAASAAAVLAHSAGRFDEVLSATDPLLRLEQRTGLDEPGFLEWQPIYIEALIRRGRLEDAAEFLAGHRKAAEDVGQPSLIGVTRRLTGLLLAARGETHRAMAEFLHAGELAREAGTRFDAALAELQSGQLLGRSGRRREAIAALDRGLATLTRLGAAPFVEIALRELSGLGLDRDVEVASLPSRLLTRQELTVARFVTEGLTNREIATELYISAKTVEFHLANVFRKLGVSSRTQLVRRLGEG